jgi:virginiamycin B lyase
MGMEFNKDGNLWFTDQLNNAIWQYKTSQNKFERNKVPTRGSYPIQIAFDSIGRVWLSEIFGKKLGVIDPNKTENNTSKGITEYELKNSEFETMGPVTISQDNRSVWFTRVTSPMNEKTVKYSTSLPTSNTTTTLLYWNTFKDGKVWFNEHEGNTIAYLDTANMTLVEFEIPSRSSLSGNTSNPLKFALDNNGSVWVTEWTENKLGLLDSKLLDKIPLSLSVSKAKVELNKNQQKAEALQVTIYPKKSEVSGPVEMTVAGSMSPAGRLWNWTIQRKRFSYYE